MTHLLMGEKKCNQCLISANRIVSKQRAAGIIQDCIKKDTHFICHKSTTEPIACRGFYDAYPDTLIFRLVKQFKIPITHLKEY